MFREKEGRSYLFIVFMRHYDPSESGRKKGREGTLTIQ